jgi:phosphate transport system substrate-binding protein
MSRALESIPTLACLTILALLVPLLSSCAQQQVASQQQAMNGTITVSGAFALYPMMVKWGDEFSKLNPDVNFDISAGGAGKGLSDALAGAADLGMVSREVTKEEEAKGAWWVGVTKDAVFPVINASNPVLEELMAEGLKKEQLADIFLNEKIKTWGELVGRPEVTDPIDIYTRSDSAGAAEAWAKFLGNKKQEDLKGIGVQADPGLLDAVIKDTNGIGYNNLAYAYDAASDKPVAGAIVAPIDVNGDGKASDDEILETKKEAMEAVASGRYPSPPARALNLVTKDKPSPLVAAFLKWVLTDGQKFVNEGGYVQLTPEQLQAGLKRLE